MCWSNALLVRLICETNPSHLLFKNTTKLAEVKIMIDERETEKVLEKKHLFENKLFLAEQKREQEIKKKLDNIRKHVRIFFLIY